MDALAALQVPPRSAVFGGALGGPKAAPLSGTWRLLWTSEKETLFCLERGLLGVGPAGESFQARSILLLFNFSSRLPISARMRALLFLCWNARSPSSAACGPWRSIDWPINQSIDQSINQSINQSPNPKPR